ncbi:ankyrin repeat domain-containing protein [Pyrenophora tritici-repentis]|nr:ankyrin repeat domain-containing protein [Pyrenophora tritici-repentis]
MRLLYTASDGTLQWTKDIIRSEEIPPYAILSHTWGEQEVVFDDLKDIENAQSKEGYRKIRFCAQQAERDGLNHFWVDTCCIDKANNTELSEAINSMFRWYQNAKKCYVYLSDVEYNALAANNNSSQRWEPAFRKSRWFSRGWTLQELLAPASVDFFSKEGGRLGDKRSLEHTIHEITGIAIKALSGSQLSEFSVAERFSWAANRQTKREEDEAYCLLGIFGIYLPLIYGEQRLSAIKRLLNEIEPPANKPLQAIKEDTEAVRNHVPAVTSGIDTIRQDQDSAKHRRLVEWLSISDYPAQQSDIIKRRQEGTGRWFLDAPELARWLNESKTTLFCPGIPGAGKTMIAAIAIDHLLNTAQNSSHGVAYVYCNYKAQEEQDVLSLLAAILKQLVQGRMLTVDHIERLHLKHASRGTKPSLDEIYGALRDVLASYQSVYIVIDALDECQEGTRRQFLAKLQDLQAIQDVRLIATSRFITDIEDAFRGAPRLEVRASREDVKRFVAGQTYRLPASIQRSTELQQMVQEKIVDAVDGMFLLARLHTDSLLDKRTAKDVKKTLAKLTKGAAALDFAYGEALERIDGQLEGDCQLARKVLSWITLAKRPLTTTEICCALAVEPEEDKIDPENVLTPGDLVSVCAGLVVVDQESDIIRLVHYTTQEYFEQTGDVWNPGGQEDIATTCLTYLSFSAFQSGSCSTDKEFEERLQQNRFLDYSAKHWGRHAGTVEAKVAALACELLQGNSFPCIAQVLWVRDYGYEGYSADYPVRTALHYTSQFGLPGITEKVLASVNVPIVEAVNAKDSWGHAPLPFAAENGQLQMVQLLLDAGAEVNAQGGPYGNALQAASFGGHEQIVKTLLDAGADVNAQSGEYGNALQVVKTLFDAGAEVNAQGGYYGNALYAASDGGHEQIVKTLLDKGADVNAQGGHYGNALQAASVRGHEQVVKMLLDAGAEVNAQGGHYGNALYGASDGGHEQIVKTLLDKGADVNAQGGEYGNALQAASDGGHEQIVKTLLDKGADVNAQGGEYGNALQAASDGGHEQIVKTLLDAGADVNAQGGPYGNALQAASAEGHEQVVKTLLDAGADVNAQGGDYGNALQAASDGGHEQIVKTLLDAGADVNAQGGPYGNALLVVKTLFDAGVNAQGGDYGNALQAASFGGHEQIVKTLLDKGADVNAQGRPYGNALQAASVEGHEQVVKMLLDAGADVNAQGGHYGNALQAASDGGHEQVVKMLLDADAHQHQEDDLTSNPV